MASEDSERRLAAIMFTDIVGYTALMEESEARGLLARERHRALLGPLAERLAGEIVDENGDELVLSFPSALNAVHCALAAQEGALDAGLQLRIGIHLGDVIFEGGRVYGDGVNVAAHIRPLSAPGGICVSYEVYHSIRNQEDIQAVPLGPQQLKNVAQPIEVYAVGRPGTLSAPRPTSRPPLIKRFLAAVALAALFALGAWGWNRTVLAPRPTGPIRSIAVLPLENLSGDPEQEYFADGMTGTTITELGKIGALQVRPWRATKIYKRSTKSIPEISVELTVDGIVEGSIYRGGNRLRVDVQLIDARSNSQLWTESYEGNAGDVLTLQRRVARAIATELRLELTPAERAGLEARPIDPRAYEAYVRGLELFGPDGLARVWAPKAIPHLERAVTLDPEFAEAYARLAWAHYQQGSLGLNAAHRVELLKAREAALHALEIDERQGDAHSTLAGVLLWYDWDFAGARLAYERAVELSPSDPKVLGEYAWFLWLADVQIRDDLWDEILRVAPIDVWFRGDRVVYLIDTRRGERALAELERVRELDPEWTNLSVYWNYLQLGRYEEFHTAWLDVWRGCGPPCAWMVESHERGWEVGGWEGAVRATIEAARDRDDFSPWFIGAFEATVGETDAAFESLERGYSQRDPLMALLKSHPILDPIRGDPRYDDMLRRIGFPES